MTDNVTLPILAELGKYWGQHPPIHLLAGLYFGIGKDINKKKLTPEEEKQALIEDLRQVSGKINLKNG